MPNLNDDIFWMQQAMQLANKASSSGEVPVGAILVLDNKIIGEGYNAPIISLDPTAHAEIIALRSGAKKINNYRILAATLYVTLEPCLMCAGAMVHARIQRLVFGADDSKAGAIVSQARTLDHAFLNHQISYAGGVCAKECGELLSNFFRARRGHT